MFNLKNQVAIITGGARGIGEGIGKIFCKAGATVILWDVLDGSEVAARIGMEDSQIHYTNVDVTKRDQVENAVSEIMERFGRIDILINNAGITKDRSFLKMSEEEWSAVINVNLNGVFVTTQVVLPYMKAANYGRIISASSINAMTGAFGQTNYSATKAAIQGFTRSLCREVGKYGITVNCVAPGYVQSAMTESLPENIVAAAIQMTPLRRIGMPEDIAYAYLFLASKEAEFVNGTTLHVNGGAYPI